MDKDIIYNATLLKPPTNDDVAWTIVGDEGQLELSPNELFALVKSAQRIPELESVIESLEERLRKLENSLDQQTK